MRAVSQLQSLLDLLLSPIGILAMSLFVVLLAAITVSKVVKWGTLTGMLYVSTLGKYEQPWFDHTLLPPFEQIRDESRAIVGGLLIALLIPVFMSARGWRTRLVLGSTAVFFLLELLYAVRMFQVGLMGQEEMLARGATSIVVYTLFFVTLGIGLSKWLHTIEDAHTVLRCLAVTGALFVAGVVFHLILSPSVMAQTRFHGTTANAQHASGVIALLLPPICYLLQQRTEWKQWRVVLAITVGMLVPLLLWTGSRNGLLMTVVGLGLFFRARLKRLIVVVIVVGVFAIVALQVFEESTRNVERLMSTQDTRSERWSQLVDDFVSSPIIGHIGDQPAIKENAYLSVAARLGVMGLIPLGVFLALVGKDLFKLHQSRRLLGEDALLADLVTSGLVAMIVGSCFEGFLLGTIAFWVPFIYIYLALLAFLLDAIKVHSPT